MDDDQIIAQRIAGKSVRSIAKLQGCSVTQVNQVIDAWAEEAIDDQLRMRSLCLELQRLDELMKLSIGAPSMMPNVQCGLLVAKLIERRKQRSGHISKQGDRTLRVC
ncbi:MAG: hypothetical protein J2P54_19130 [Bradyrhizobiaceae bacterium]|nr:hypothetical protein [Bradyrhizobiaceae bacterium]